MINYQAIADALRYYKELGYFQIDVPWDITHETMMITCPSHISVVEGKWDKIYYMVGSAEQSFIHLDILGKLEKNKKYVACTPCFRNDIEDELHQKYFMKVELYYSLDFDDDYKNAEDKMFEMLYDAKQFFHSYNDLNNEIKIQKTNQGYDLELNEIELGSYGVRKHAAKQLHWVYGTGLAEPRFSIVCNNK